MKGISGIGGADTDVRVGQPHGACGWVGLVLPGSPTASTESIHFSGRGKLSGIIPSSCKHVLLINRVVSSLAM